VDIPGDDNGGDMKARQARLGIRQAPTFSCGAASEVRHIDPTTYQPPEQRKVSARPPAQNKTEAMLDSADAILLKDAKRRFGKRRARNMIVMGRYR
jgi:hypothetical protein